MEFIELNTENMLQHLNKLNSDTQPQWGSMTAQHMVEHLSDAIDMSLGKKFNDLQIPEDKVGRAQQFLISEHPMPKNFKAHFVQDAPTMRHSEIELAIDEFTEKWIEFEQYFEENPEAKFVHPNFGELDKTMWNQTHRKHFTHHFEQFNLI